MRDEKRKVLKEELLSDINHLSKRLKDYDWDYRLTRYDEKISKEKNKTVNVLEEIELSENNKFSDN